MGHHRAERPHRRPAVVSPAPRTRTAPAAAAGRRRAATRPALLRGLPSAPIAAGIATVAIAAFGTLSATPTAITADPSVSEPSLRSVSAMTGSAGQATSNLLGRRGQRASRDSGRDTRDSAAGTQLVEAAEAQSTERNEALALLSQAAESQAAKIRLNVWVYPTAPVALTATYGQYGLWANYHTGLDFNGNTGDPIMAVSGGVVTSSGYDGAYGNKTVVTLADGTEIWYCHQNAMYVAEGDEVRAGEVIGEIGATGNVTGSHLHLEVRPGGGDPVDPYAALAQHGLF